jgi:hypothetical protein
MKLTDLIDSAYGIINGILIPLAFALCLFYFFFGVSKYIKASSGNEKEAGQGKRMMTLGILGLFIALSVWGIIVFIRSELGIPEIQNIDKGSVEIVNTNMTPL